MSIFTDIGNAFQNFVGQYQPQNTIQVTYSYTPEQQSIYNPEDDTPPPPSSYFPESPITTYINNSGNGVSTAFPPPDDPIPWIQDPIDILLPPDRRQSRYTPPEDQPQSPIYNPLQEEYQQTYSNQTTTPSGNFLAGVGFDLGGVDISQVYVPGLDYTQNQMSVNTQSTTVNIQPPDTNKFEYPSESTAQQSIGYAKDLFTGSIENMGQNVVFGAGKTLDVIGDQFGYASDIIITPEQTAIEEANKLIDPDLQAKAQEYINNFNESTTPIGFQGADRYLLLGKIKALVNKQNEINKNTNTNVLKTIEDTQTELNKIITEQNKLFDNKIEVGTDPDTGKEVKYFTGTDTEWQEVNTLTIKINKLEDKLERNTNKLPTYENLPETDTFRNVIGITGDIVGQTVSGTGQVLQEVSPYADVTKIPDMNADQFFTGARTALTSVGLVTAGAISEGSKKLGVVELPKGTTGEKTLARAVGIKDYDLGALDFNKLSDAYAYDGKAMDYILPERNVVDKMLYETGATIPDEVKNVGLVFKPSAWEEQPNEVAEGLITTAVLAIPTYKLLKKGTQAAIEWKFTRDIGKMEGRVIADDVVLFKTQFGKKGVAKEVGDVIVEQRIDTLKNTISSKTYQFVKKDNKVVKNLVSEVAEAPIASNVDRTFMAELRKQLQSKPNKIKLDNTIIRNTLVKEDGFSGAINTRIRRKARVTVGQEAKGGVIQKTQITGKEGKKQVSFAGPAETGKPQGINELAAIIGEDAYGIQTTSPVRRLIQKTKLKMSTIKEGQLYRQMLGGTQKTEQALKIGKKTDIGEAWAKPIYNEGGELIGIQRYVKPGPIVKEKISQTTNINLGGMIEDGSLSNVVTALKTRSGGPMRFQYNPLEVAEGTIKQVGKGSGKMGKKGQQLLQTSQADEVIDFIPDSGKMGKKGQQLLQTSQADEVIDFIPDLDVTDLRSALLGPTTKTTTSRFALTKIKTPSNKLTEEALKNVLSGKKLYLDSQRFTLPTVTENLQKLAMLGGVEVLKNEQELTQEQELQQRLLQTQLLQQRQIQRQDQQQQLLQDKILQQEQIIRQSQTQRGKTITAQQTITQQQLERFTPFRTTPVRPTKPEKPKTPIRKIPKIVFGFDDKDFTPRIKKKKKKKKFSTRYSASLSGLISGSKKKPKTITGVERRGSLKDYSKQVRQLTGL